MKKNILLFIFVLASTLSFAQTIQYKDKDDDSKWMTLEYKDIQPGCLKGKEALKLSGDFSNFTVKWKITNDSTQAYETGPVIAVCCYTASETYPDKIFKDLIDNTNYPAPKLKYVDLSEVTDINSMQYIFARCYDLKTIDFPNQDIKTASKFEHAFYGCNALQKADLSMFKNIDNLNKAFSNCYDMTEVKFCQQPSNKDVYIDNTFIGCINLKGIDLSMYKIMNDKTIVEMPETFGNCYSLDYVYLPQGYVDYVKSFLDKNKNNNDYKPQESIFGEDYNPNCLKILSKDDDNPKLIMDDWDNVVYGDEAFTDINLTEGFIENKCDDSGKKYYTYECPKDIQLGDKKAIFTPLMSEGPYDYKYANGKSGWNTIVLPFTGALQKGINDAEYTSVYPATKGFPGYYWLREYKDGYGETVSFDIVNDVDTTSGEALKANTPYIIAFPGKKFGDDNMIVKSLRFISTTYVLPKTTELKVKGDSKDYALQGNLNGNQVTGTAYKLVYGGNNSQDYFDTTKDENLPFHAQIIATSEASNAKRLSINSYNGTTGIIGTKNQETSQLTSTYFTTDGVDTGIENAKLLKKGIYIHGNKKIVIK